MTECFGNNNFILSQSHSGSEFVSWFGSLWDLIGLLLCLVGCFNPYCRSTTSGNTSLRMVLLDDWLFWIVYRVTFTSTKKIVIVIAIIIVIITDREQRLLTTSMICDSFRLMRMSRLLEVLGAGLMSLLYLFLRRRSSYNLLASGFEATFVTRNKSIKLDDQRKTQLLVNKALFRVVMLLIF